MLLRNIERQDIWDQIIDANSEPVIRPIEVFSCPDDTEAATAADLPALSYSANTGAWDLDDSGKFLRATSKAPAGDVAANGVMFNVAQLGKKAPKTRISGIKDGANMTILLTENINKTYDPESGAPACTWLYGTEQHLGVVWVVDDTPQPGNGLDQQEGINRNAFDLVAFDPAWPRFARPSSGHSGGVNTAFCDSHVKFLPETIDYIVYQQLLTTNGAKCEDPMQHEPVTDDASPAIQAFRRASPLSEADYQ
jgi:prepilin-type processing-associated H-X9-DG protein